MVLRHQKKHEEPLTDESDAFGGIVGPDTADECSFIHDTSMETGLFDDDDTVGIEKQNVQIVSANTY